MDNKAGTAKTKPGETPMAVKSKKLKEGRVIIIGTGKAKTMKDGKEFVVGEKLAELLVKKGVAKYK